MNPKPQKKVIMNHTLAKALMEAGVQHFDGGGGVLGGVGNAISGVAGDFTTQNHYQASNPYSTADQQAALQQQNALYGQQSQLAQALLAQSQGKGPNPALEQLKQTTQQNGQNAAGLVASQRGLNPGMAARIGSENLINANQQAGGQAATLSAEQQLAAENNLAGVYQNQATENSNQQGIENQANLGAAGINAQVDQQNANAVNKTNGSLLNSAGSAAQSVGSFIGGLFNKGGEIPEHFKAMAKVYHPEKFADGGVASYSVNVPTLQGPTPDQAPAKSASPLAPTAEGAPDATGSSVAEVATMKKGGKVPGKAKVKGDSPKNDVVPTMLSPGEDVIPRSITQAPNAPEKAAEFIKHLQAKDGKKSEESDDSGYGKVAKAKGSLSDRVARLEKLLAGAK